MHKPRKLSIYERNQLLKYSFKETDLLTKGNLPVEYLTGRVNFCGFDLQVNSSVLIPRVETEELIEPILSLIRKINRPLRYLEVGTGSGAISVAVFAALQKLPQLQLEQFILTDVSAEALDLAKLNLQTFFSDEALEKITFVQSDLLMKVPSQNFDVIVANLPYIPSAEIKKLDVSVKNYEPHLALDGGETGFELIASFLEQIITKHFLATSGQIFLEVHESHTKSFIAKHFPDFLTQFTVREIKDQFSRQRFLILQHF